VYIGGKFEKIISNVVHYDYQELRMNPASAKKFFKENNWNTIIAF
jgi:ATP sulfurylase